MTHPALEGVPKRADVVLERAFAPHTTAGIHHHSTHVSSTQPKSQETTRSTTCFIGASCIVWALLWGVKRVRYLIAVICLLALAGCTKEPPPYEPRYTTPPPEAPLAQVALIGDSYANQLQFPLNREAAINTAHAAVNVRPVGGSGYVNRGYRNAVFGDAVPDVVKPDTRMVVFFGSGNDADEDPQAVAEAARAAYSRAHEIAPQARLVVIGFAWVRGGDVAPNWLALRDALRSEADDAGAVFVDPIAEQWFVGMPQLIGPDKIHPNQTGDQYLADKIAPIIAGQLG